MLQTLDIILRYAELAEKFSNIILSVTNKNNSEM